MSCTAELSLAGRQGLRRSRRPWGAHRLSVLALAMLGLLVSACQPRGPRDGVDLEAIPGYAALATQHNDRAKLLDKLYANGVVEIRWTDDKGKHFEQGDVDIWLRMPNEVALQVTKMGERLFWLGANADASWFFDLRKAGQTFAEIDDPTAQAVAEDGAPLAVSMATLLELMGLAEIPAAKPENAPDVTYDETTKAWVATTQGSAGPMRIFIDVERNLPVRVELLQASQGEAAFQGELLVYSVLPLRSYEYVFVAGRAVDQFPRVPTTVDIHRADGSGRLKLSVGKPVSDDPSFHDHYFDLNWLLAALQPDDVRDLRSAGGEAR